LIALINKTLTQPTKLIKNNTEMQSTD